MEKFINYVCKPLVLIGALNWGLVGGFNFNLVQTLLGTGIIANIVYLLVGISALGVIYSYTLPKSKSNRE